MEQLKLAKKICKIAHKGQKDKGGKAYYRHPFAVAKMCETVKEKTVAYLHDVIEDSDFTLEELRGFGFDEDILTAVDCITKKNGQDYEEYIQNVKKNPLARVVKICDMTHNSCLKRLKTVTERDVLRVEKYKKAIEFLRAE